MIWLAFCAMVIMIAPAMRWTWLYVAVVIVTGPIGALMVWARLRDAACRTKLTTPTAR